MKTIAIIGSSGLLGSDLVRFLSTKFKVSSINKGNYQTFRNNFFDIVINANGNSKRFWANKNRYEDFLLSTISVYKSIFDFHTNLYIYISSPDIYENHSNPNFNKENNKINYTNLKPYGFHKYLSELFIKTSQKRFIILRSSLILGASLKKGPFFDITNDKPLFISLDSKLQVISTKGIADIIEVLVSRNIFNKILNIGGKGAFLFSNIKKYINKDIKFSDEVERQEYEMDIKQVEELYPNLKTSEEYIKEFIKSCMI